VKRDVAAGALLVALIVGLSLLVPHDERPPGATRSSADYAPGGYRAWFELAAREGVAVTRFRSHHELLAANRIDTLIEAFPTGAVPIVWNAAERDATLAWVRRGGTLVDVGGAPPVGGRLRVSAPASPAFVTVKRRGGGLRGPWASVVGTLPSRGDDRVARGRAHAAVLLADASGALVTRQRLGNGELVRVAPAAAFENGALARGDDARLAYLLARPHRPHGVVAFDEAIRGDIVERPWYQALDVSERVALGFAVVAGLLWLAYGIVPLGPGHRAAPPREPTSAEFVEAVAALYGRARARDHARDALIAEARRSLERLPRTPETTALAERVDAATASPVANDAELIAAARLARRIREETKDTMIAERTARRRARAVVRSA